MTSQPRPPKFWDSADSKPVAVAHRGGDGAGISKENSLKAFQAAYGIGYRWFETDVVPTRDGKLLAIHGKGYQRHPNRNLPSRTLLQRMNYSKIIEEIQVGGEPVLLLVELLEAFPECKFFIDPKTYRAAPVLADILISNPDYLKRVCVGSFLPLNTSRVTKLVKKATGKEASVSILGPIRSSLIRFSSAIPWLTPLARRHISSTGAESIHVPFKRIYGVRGDMFIQAAHRLGLRVGVYTPNDEHNLRLCRDKGVDIIMSDSVRLLKAVIFEKDSNNSSLNGNS